MSSKLRDAVSRLVREIEDGMLIELSGKFESDLAKTLLADVKAALAEPLLNCDVGTASDMAQRFKQFCHENCSLDKCCDECPLKLRRAPCEFEWARMPYEEGETDEQK